MNRRYFSDFAGFGPGGEPTRSEGRSPDFIENWVELLNDRGRDHCSLFPDASGDDRSAVLALGAIALSWRTASAQFPPDWNKAVHALERQYADSSIELWRAAESAIARLEQPVAERVPERVRVYLRNCRDDLARDRYLLELLVALDELDSLLLARAALARWLESSVEPSASEDVGELPMIVAVARWVAYQSDRLSGTEEWFKARAVTLSDEATVVTHLSPRASTPADSAFAAACSWILTAANAVSRLEDEEAADPTEEQLSRLAKAYGLDREASARSVLATIRPELSAHASMAHPALLACRAMSLWSQPKLAAASTSGAISPSAAVSWMSPSGSQVFEVSAVPESKPEFISLLCYDAAGNRCNEHDGEQLRWLGAVAVVVDGVAQLATKDLRADGSLENLFQSAACIHVGDAEWRFRPSGVGEADA